MKHTILTVLLTLGVIGGLTYGFTHHGHERWQRHSRFKEQVADICVGATLRTLKENAHNSSANQHHSP
jgi:hypothetical protein